LVVAVDVAIDCDMCRNKNTYRCDMCVHNDYLILDDYFECSPDELTRLHQASIERAQNEAITEWISIPNISEEFRKAFNTAKKCAATEHWRPYFMGVFVRDGELVASNTDVILVMPFHDIPSQLRNKVDIKIDGDKAGITSQTYPEYEFLFCLCNYVAAPIAEVEIGPPLPAPLAPDRQWQILSHGSFSAKLSKVYIDLMRDVLTGNVIVSHSTGSNVLPILFIGANGRMLIMPLVNS